ncbi:MAG: D-alanyl-D-alanine carboxypeptidase [Selenomonadaceae bacterium]|nr:D-alanyl-D-alanine carboxypeptidase [Selenomonadaceae bacterium]
MVKKFSLSIFAVVFFITSLVSAAPSPSIQVTADSAILVEASTGRVIYEKNADVVRPPASLTKMMTCIIGLEKFSPFSDVVASQNAASTDFSTLALNSGDIVNSYELLTGMMLVSDNGGAVAVAENIAGSVQNFAQMMNDKAREIGCEYTNFANPHGLPNPNHVSTARDMSKIAMYCMKNLNFRQIVSTQKMTMNWKNPAGRTILCENTNELLYKDDRSRINVPYNPAEITGIKTGYTDAAGPCLAAGAKRNDVELIAVVLHCETHDSRFDDAAKLLNYGLENVRMMRQTVKDHVENINFANNGKKATLRVGANEEIVFAMLSSENIENFSIEYEVPKTFDENIERGQVVGQAVLKYAGEKIASVPLFARERVTKEISITNKITGWTMPFFSTLKNFWMEYFG